ncbi:MAG: hypothetical protein JWM11_2660 [Planctomycetaceae bacterium]|nr:hypothetical protein [Planctomycetaceae bacterium]
MSHKKWGLVDLNGNTVLPLHYDFVNQVSENGIVAVRNSGVAHYIYLDGTSAVPGEFDRALPFYWGTAVVQQDGLYGVINEAGEWIVECQYERLSRFNSDLAAVRLNDRFGYINRKGEVVVPLVYKDAQDIHEGLGWLQDLNGNWGCVDTAGKVRIPFKYQEVERFGESLAFVVGSDHTGFINSSGELVIEPHGWSRSYGGFSENVACVMGVRRDEYSWGYSYIDHTGQFTITKRFKEVYNFSCERAMMQTKKRWGYINKLGKTIIPAVYEFADNFKFDIGVVKYNGKMGCIGLDGETVFPFEYDLVWIAREGLLRVAIES